MPPKQHECSRRRRLRYSRCMKTALIIRHTPYEGIAGFSAQIEAAGYEIDRILAGD